MEENRLCLKPGVTLVEQDGKTGLTLGGVARFTREPRQAEILRLLTHGAQPLTALPALLASGADPPDEGTAALALADLILAFEDYLED
jgi:hypothetical protein